MLELLGLRVESKQALDARRLHAGVFRKPDHAARIDVHFVDAVLGVRQLVVLLYSRTRIQLDQTMGIAAIGQPHIAVLIETHILAGSPSHKCRLQLVVFRRIRALARRIGRQVILDVHRLAEFGFIQRHFLLDSDGARFGVRSEVFHQICRLAHHSVESRNPHSFTAGSGGKEILTVTDQAGSLRHVPSGSWRVDLVVALLLGNR